VIIPIRGSRQAFTISWDLDELVLRFDDLNKTLEELWLSILSVLVERWPDWPVEVWSRLSPIVDVENPRYDLDFLISVGAVGPDDKHVATVVRFLTAGVAKLVSTPPRFAWERIQTDCKPLWLIDDGRVYRALAPEASIDRSVYLLGHYAGEPIWFAATLEAWPLHGVHLPLELTDVDTAWAFEP
jgi:hypothetical protein